MKRRVKWRLLSTLMLKTPSHRKREREREKVIEREREREDGGRGLCLY